MDPIQIDDLNLPTGTAPGAFCPMAQPSVAHGLNRGVDRCGGWDPVEQEDLVRRQAQRAQGCGVGAVQAPNAALGVSREGAVQTALVAQDAIGELGGESALGRGQGGRLG